MLKKIIQKATIKNGPKAIFVFNFAFLNINKKKATIPPKINEVINQVNPFSNPNQVPSAIANLTSPKPIPRPRVNRCITRSKKAHINPANRLENKGL